MRPLRHILWPRLRWPVWWRGTLCAATWWLCAPRPPRAEALLPCPHFCRKNSVGKAKEAVAIKVATPARRSIWRVSPLLLPRPHFCDIHCIGKAEEAVAVKVWRQRAWAWLRLCGLEGRDDREQTLHQQVGSPSHQSLHPQRTASVSTSQSYENVRARTFSRRPGVTTSQAAHQKVLAAVTFLPPRSLRQLKNTAQMTT